MDYTKQFYRQKDNAKLRGIDWQLTYDQWLEIWVASGHLHERGKRKGQYCMSRYGDVGPYSVDNVFIQLVTQNNSDGHKGKPAHNKGTTHTEEARQKISAARKGKSSWNKGKSLGPLSEEHRQKLSAAKKGRSPSEEHRQKLSAANKGRPAHNKGKPSSEEIRKKISEAKKKYYQLQRAKKLTNQLLRTIL